MNIYIPENVRSCQNHLDDRGFILSPLLPSLRFINKPYIINGQQLHLFLQELRNVAINSTRFEDEHSFTDEEFHSISPITKEQFLELFTFCDPVPCQRGHRYITKKDLLMFLCKLRQGLTDEFLKLMFQYSSRQAVSLAVAIVRQSLMLRFVPGNIGLDSITPEEYIERHVTEFANELYNPNPDIPRVIVYIDGTYSYIEKSSNFRTLRQSYCVHKGRHLVKPALLVSPNGYILDIHGPYFSDSRNNDAAMLQNEFDRNEDRMREWFPEGSIIVVDRGYRDVTELFRNLGIYWKMPALLQPGQRQLSTEEANESRLVTKTRWIVEARNGHIKSIFKFFAQVIRVPHLHNLGNFYRIAGAIINRYHAPIEMQGANAELARQLIRRAQEVNVVQALVEEEQLQARNAQRWLRLSSQHVQDFPELTLEYLRDLTVGVYQVNLAPGYIQDKLQREEQEELQLEVLRHVQMIPEPGLIRVRVFSRFRNATKHQLWIAYVPIEDMEHDAQDENNPDPIQGYYCTCQSGARTLGSCAHVASVLWYLGYARHENNVRYPSTSLHNVIMDAADRPAQQNPN